MSYSDPEARRQYARQHYLANRDLYIKRAKVNKRRTVQQNRQRLLDYLQVHPCCDCGESDPVVLQFDHLGTDKAGLVCRMVIEGFSWQTVVAEIAKCDVVCANCHFRRTARRHGGWFKALSAGVAQLADATASNAV